MRTEVSYDCTLVVARGLVQSYARGRERVARLDVLVLVGAGDVPLGELAPLERGERPGHFKIQHEDAVFAGHLRVPSGPIQSARRQGGPIRTAAVARAALYLGDPEAVEGSTKVESEAGSLYCAGLPARLAIYGSTLPATPVRQGGSAILPLYGCAGDASMPSALWEVRPRGDRLVCAPTGALTHASAKGSRGKRTTRGAA